METGERVQGEARGNAQGILEFGQLVIWPFDLAIWHLVISPFDLPDWLFRRLAIYV
jgi:hypothetical protein